MIDFQQLNGKATALITSIGLPITVSRNGQAVGKGFGVFSPSQRRKEQGATSPSTLDIESKTLYMTSNQKLTPAVGDIVTAKTGQWQVIAVEEYRPASITVAFRLEVQ